jgi:hypothetical protein
LKGVPTNGRSRGSIDLSHCDFCFWNGETDTGKACEKECDARKWLPNEKRSIWSEMLYKVISRDVLTISRSLNNHIRIYYPFRTRISKKIQPRSGLFPSENHRDVWWYPFSRV